MRVFLDANLLIYLNVGSTEEILDFWISLLGKADLYTDVLVLDETLWISKKKYGVDYRDTIEFIEQEVLPYTTILPSPWQNTRLASVLIIHYNLKPSDALHLAAMKNNGITLIASEGQELTKYREYADYG